MNRKPRGFTLVEVMIVVAIVAILGAIAVPAYNDYVTRGRIPDATSMLATRQVQLEQWFQDRRTYLGSDAGNGPCRNDATGRFFDFSCDNLTDTTFRLIATGKGPMANFSFTVNQANVRTTASVPANWVAPAPNNCWVARKGGECS